MIGDRVDVPVRGELAGLDSGPGCLDEPAEILAAQLALYLGAYGLEVEPLKPLEEGVFQAGVQWTSPILSLDYYCSESRSQGM